jgi:hypothetical protein
MENMNTHEGENASIRYSIIWLDGRIYTSKLRKNTDLCPICKNGSDCIDSFAHGGYWT